MHSKLNGELGQLADSFEISEHQEDVVSKDFTLNELLGSSSKHQGGYRSQEELEFKFAQKGPSPAIVTLKVDDEIPEKEMGLECTDQKLVDSDDAIEPKKKEEKIQSFLYREDLHIEAVQDQGYRMRRRVPEVANQDQEESKLH